ncbi:hypothetical protein ACP70R_014558 [Stipagrostis hirtigluma subsp. patula]
MAPPPPELIDDVTAEILLRLPPAEPACLFRAALVCKRWLRVICDPAFLRRYRAFHRTPPLLGLLHGLPVTDGNPGPTFIPIAAAPRFRHPWSDDRRSRDQGYRHLQDLDCRHGRVLSDVVDESVGFIVWDPVTGDHQALPVPGIDIPWMTYTSAVLCGAVDCDHLDCHGKNFRVVLVGSNNTLNTLWASVYSSETSAWSTPISIDYDCDNYVGTSRGALIGDEIYFLLSRGTAIVKYNWGKNRLSLVNPPPPPLEAYNGWVTLMVMEDSSLGLAGIKNSNLHMWLRKVNTEGSAEWIQSRVIELETMTPMAKHGPYVVGFAENVSLIFVSTGFSLFAIEPDSGQVRKIPKRGVSYDVLPYMSFCTPGSRYTGITSEDFLISVVHPTLKIDGSIILSVLLFASESYYYEAVSILLRNSIINGARATMISCHCSC